jgi:hypothetical protein
MAATNGTDPAALARASSAIMLLSKRCVPMRRRLGKTSPLL